VLGEITEMPARSTPQEEGMAVRVLADLDATRESGRVAVGIDPSRAALQIASLSPRGDQRRERRVPLGPAAVGALEEELEGRDATIAFEGSHATGQLFLLELLARGTTSGRFSRSSPGGSARR
jgi:hypothetical protein